MKKKITDKQRLDWLRDNGQDLVEQRGEWWVYCSGHKWHKSPRAAIDAAIREERRAK